MAEIRWTEEALGWLQNIHEFISGDSPWAACNLVEEIYEKTQTLSRFPEIGYKYRDDPDGEIRILLYGHYRIAYLIKDNAVEILGIFHGALKIEEYINK